MTRNRSRRTTGASSTGGTPSKVAGNRALLRELDVCREELATQNGDLRRANAALSAANERYAQLYDTAPIAYFTLNEERVIVEANLVGEELLDTTRDFLFGRTFDELVVPSSRASFREVHQHVLALGGRLIHDTVLSLSKRRFPARIVAGRIGGRALLASDCLLCITDETDRRYLDGTNAVRSTRASVEAQRKSDPLDVSAVVRAMGARLTGVVPRDALILDLADDLPVVVGDSAQLEQIVLYLVENAAEALSRKSGRVLVRTRAESMGGASPAEAGGSVVIEVTDDGAGMDAGTRQHAFDPFFSTKLGRRGLGLAVVHRNVRAHGGTVTIESRPHGGTTLRVSLPARPRELVSGSSPANDAS